MNELKPCPFCGGEPKIILCSTECDHGIVVKRFKIKCVNCLVEQSKLFRLVAKIKDDMTFEFNDSEREEAIEAWNRRVNENV